MIRTKSDRIQKEFRELVYSATNYFGNEYSEAYLYTSAALCIEVPEYTERRKILVSDSLLDEEAIAVNAEKSRNMQKFE